MPYKRRYVPKHARKKKVVRRSRYPRQKFKFAKGLSRQVVPFTREVETYFRLSSLAGNNVHPFTNFVHTSDGGVVGQIRIRLNDLPGVSDFTNLFRQYKLNYMKIIFYPAANTATAGAVRTEGGNYGNNNILIRTMLNRTGIAMQAGNTVSDWSQVMAKKQWMLAQDKPTTITCKLSQLAPAAGGSSYPPQAGNEVYTVVKPKYISTNNPSCLHYGLNIRFDSCDGSALDSDEQRFPQFRIVCKVYMTAKGVA